MKKVTVLVATALFMSTALPAFAETATTTGTTVAGRDECLLATQNCVTQVDDIQKRVVKLNKEVKKGTKVYTPEELKKLQQKLDETRALLDQIERPGGE